jgi:ribulose 1,5-bisphosphate carboxylase large subunit-like protein
VAARIAEIETTAQWMAGGEPSDLFVQCKGEVAEIHEIEPGKGTFTVLFPLCNIDLERDAFSSTWLLMIGGGTFALLDYQKSRLLDFSLPDWAYSFFPGPKFGIRETRQILGVDNREVIIGTIVKPTSGLTAEEVADLCYRAALAGVRFIKDDEKMMNPGYCPLGKRVKLVSEALKRAEDQTGNKVIYAPHITTGPQHIQENAYIALENGATALMLNIFAAGFGSLEILARDRNVCVPLYAHCGGKEAMGRAEGQGVSPNVIAKYARLMGGCYFRSGIVGGYLVGDVADSKRINEALAGPIPGIKDAVPALSGGLGPKNIGENIATFGLDVLYLAGSGVFSHPMGAQAGVEAMKQAAQAHLAGIELSEYAKDHPELAVAL